MKSAGLPKASTRTVGPMAIVLCCGELVRGNVSVFREEKSPSGDEFASRSSTERSEMNRNKTGFEQYMC